MPYGVRSESVTAYNVVSGRRPSRPDNPTADRWLTNPIWDAITRCWDQDPQLRLPTSLLCRAFFRPELEQEWGTLVAWGGEGES